MVSDLHVGVEKHVIIRLYSSQGPVVAFGKAIVAIKPQRAHHGETLGEHLQRTICRGVVGHPYLRVVLGVFYDIGQILHQHFPAIPVKNHYRSLHISCPFSAFLA